jgi:hypothetical protein
VHRGTWAALFAFALIASPARAEFPAAVSAWGGFGNGWGSRSGVVNDGSFVLVGAEAAWRFAPGRALVVTYEGGGGPLASGRQLATISYLDRFDHVGVTVGPEFSFPSGSGTSLFCRGSAGMGRVTTDGYESIRVYDGSPWEPARVTETGFALSGAAGFRLVPRPGPVGFVFAIHAAQTWTRHSRCGGFGATFGLTIYPLNAPSSP